MVEVHPASFEFPDGSADAYMVGRVFLPAVLSFEGSRDGPDPGKPRCADGSHGCNVGPGSVCLSTGSGYECACDAGPPC